MRAPHIIRIPLPNGGYLVCGPGEDYHLGGYLAIDDDQERELVRWSSSKWETPGEGEAVIGAIFAATTRPLSELRTVAATYAYDAAAIGNNAADAPYYRLYMRVTEDTPDSWSVVVLNLPGTGSCGGRREEAITHAVESVRAALAQYRADGTPVPWRILNQDDFAAGPITVRTIFNKGASAK